MSETVVSLESPELKNSNVGYKINTDLPENRHKRACNHYNFEENVLSHTFGLSFATRFILIRASLFEGFLNIAGEDYKRLLAEGKVLSDSRMQIADDFIPSNDAARVSLENFMPMIDSWFEIIKSMPEGVEKTEATFRMIAAIFVGGTLIHPVKDGNGQTFKGLVLSYMHDLLPDKRNKFVPIKYGRDYGDSRRMMEIPFMGGGFLPVEDDLTSGAVPCIKPKSERDRIVWSI